MDLEVASEKFWKLPKLETIGFKICLCFN